MKLIKHQALNSCLPDRYLHSYLLICKYSDIFRCKYSHPAVKSESGNMTGGGGAKLQDKMEFCHDYQNGRCNRSHCKFIHCSSDVETEFKTSGEKSKCFVRLCAHSLVFVKLLIQIEHPK